jgi:deoxycytidine triphosphate deaminase
VYNEHGFSISRYARVMQLVFYTLTSETRYGYKGIYSDG